MIIIGANEPVAIFSVRLCFLRSILKSIDPQREGRRRLGNRGDVETRIREDPNKLAFGYEWSPLTRSSRPAPHDLR